MPDQDRDFDNWLRRTIRRLQHRETTALEDDLARPNYNDPGVQRRIAELIGKIAERPGRKRKNERT